MRILLLCSAFNGLSQRLHRELSARNHIVSVELALNPQAIETAAALFRPDVIICPFLKQRVPDAVWKRHACLIVHPGIEGDRGPSSLDWALQRGAPQWGVTLLQAAEEMDAGPIWGSATFAARTASKGSLYRREVTAHAVQLVLAALERLKDPLFQPRPLDYGNPLITGQWNRAMRQEDRRIDWSAHTSAEIVRHVNAADGAPGVLDEIAGLPVYLYDARPAIGLKGRPGELIASSHGAICRATVDGAVWLGQLKDAVTGPTPAIKLPATRVLGRHAPALQHLDTDRIGAADIGCNEIRYYEIGSVGYLHFDFYNGAMSTAQCQRLRQFLVSVKRRPVHAIALMGGEEFWSNGIHLSGIEAAASAADESWANINAMNDLVEEIIRTERQVTIAVLRANAGAGGAVMAAACDQVWARQGTVLNVHYRTMGLHGSEYWTYLLPKRVGARHAARLTEDCMPTLASEGYEIGLVQRLLPEEWGSCHRTLDQLCADLAESSHWREMLGEKAKVRLSDERRKPLQAYRDEELRHMYRTFYDPGSEYHEARRKFVYKRPVESTPSRLATHREARVQMSA